VHIIRTLVVCDHVPFWGLIFPNGVYANLTIELYKELDSSFFRILGAAYSVATLILWISVSARTIMLVRNQRIFEAPCLEDMDSLLFEYGRETVTQTPQTEESRSQSREREMKV